MNRRHLGNQNFLIYLNNIENQRLLQDTLLEILSRHFIYSEYGICPIFNLGSILHIILVIQYYRPHNTLHGMYILRYGHLGVETVQK